MNIINSPLRNPVGTTVFYFIEIKTKEVCHQPKHTLSNRGNCNPEAGFCHTWDIFPLTPAVIYFSCRDDCQRSTHE